jgi:hypothetical protein
MQRNSITRTARIAHRFLGLFFAPSILFFALSGIFQVLGWHQTVRGTNQAPARWIQEMAQIHKKQTWELPASKPTDGSTDNRVTPKKPSKAPVPKTALKIFVLAMSVALIATTLLGIVMALRYGGDWRIASAVVLLGALFPLAATWL